MIWAASPQLLVPTRSLKPLVSPIKRWFIDYAYISMKQIQRVMDENVFKNFFL